MEQAAELRELVNSRDVPADIATRGRIVLWSGEGRRRKDIAELLGVSLPTVDRWKTRYAEQGLAGLEGERPGGAREQVPVRVRARVIALTRMTPPSGTGLSHWSARELAKYLERTENITVSWHYIARIWRKESLKPLAAADPSQRTESASVRLNECSRRRWATRSGGATRARLSQRS
ncbi:helix-turn-helix domain-containing protein [Streptomyces sp. SM11]|uniref:helix-turn-helix domain-containing protein n=1 Tax=Streptomyces sp. SM11 TaxID=565557 RepID=UPI001CA58EBC|nr:helix-turn-helix domain-containing protein [Streptomyces sp. SM11]